MKWKIFFIALVMGVCLAPASVSAQANEIQQLALDIEKLTQFRKILKNMYEAYDIIKGGYDKVKGITSGNYSLHQGYLDGLMQISPAVRNYRRIGDIITSQQNILKEYKRAYSSFKESGAFNVKELSYIGGVYDNLLSKSMGNIGELTMVLTAGDLRMSDDERLTAIDRLADDMQKQLSFLRSFNNSTGLLQWQRQRELQDAAGVGKLYAHPQ